MSRPSSTRNALDAEADGASGSPIAIQVIERAMRLLDALAAQPEPVTLKELSATTGLHASTAHRILNDLVVGRYVERVDNGLYLSLIHIWNTPICSRCWFSGALMSAVPCPCL